MAMRNPRLLWTCLAVSALLSAGCQVETVRYRVVVIPKGLTHEFWQSIYRGAARAGADLEREVGEQVEIIWDGPLRERDALAQIRIVDRRISTRVDGIVLAPQHSQTMVAPVQRAVAQELADGASFDGVGASDQGTEGLVRIEDEVRFTSGQHGRDRRSRGLIVQATRNDSRCRISASLHRAPSRLQFPASGRSETR